VRAPRATCLARSTTARRSAAPTQQAQRREAPLYSHRHLKGQAGGPKYEADVLEREFRCSGRAGRADVHDRREACPVSAGLVLRPPSRTIRDATVEEPLARMEESHTQFLGVVLHLPRALGRTHQFQNALKRHSVSMGSGSSLRYVRRSTQMFAVRREGSCPRQRQAWCRTKFVAHGKAHGAASHWTGLGKGRSCIYTCKSRTSFPSLCSTRLMESMGVQCRHLGASLRVCHIL